MSPFLAQSRHGLLHCTCLLLGVKRTYSTQGDMCAFDQKRTLDHPQPGLILRREKSFRLVDKFLPGWFTFQKRMIAAFKRDESRARNAGCERAAFIKWYPRIITAVKDQRRHRNLREHVGNVNIRDRLHDADGVLERGRNALQVVPPLHLFRCSVRDECRSEKLSKRRIFTAPALLDE